MVCLGTSILFLSANIVSAFSSRNGSNVMHRSNRKIAPDSDMHSLDKRTYPDFVRWDSGDQREPILQSALPDTISLVQAVAEDYDTYVNIWSKYFPVASHPTVQAVWENIIGTDPTNPGTGTPTLQNCKLIGEDFAANIPLEEAGQRCQDQDNWAYTARIAGAYSTQYEAPGTSYTYFCDKAFNEAWLASNINCANLGTSVSEDMVFIGSIMLHEWLHNDNIGMAATGSVVGDILGPASYGAWATQRICIEQPDQAILNADNYAYLALEVYWTRVCNTNYGPPAFPGAVSCDYAADPDGAMDWCPDISGAGWCDCGEAGDFPTMTSGASACAYTATPIFSATLTATSCGPTDLPATTPTCGPYDADIDDANTINQMLDDLGTTDTWCCSDGSADCSNVLSSGDVGLDLCSSSAETLCVACARLANYVADLITNCASGGNTGGKQYIAEAPGLWMQL